MSESARSSTNTIVIALVVVVVVLAAVLGYSIWKNNDSVPDVSEAAAGSATGAESSGAGAATGAGTGATGGTTGSTTGAVSTEFDPKTATQVPAGTTPEDFVKAYHEDVMAQKYEDAYNKLPLDKKQSYGDAAAYGSQVAAYGITSYELGEPTEKGDTWTVAATQVTPQMPITYTWTLKKVGDQWYVVSRTMGGQ